MAKYNLAKCR